MKLSFREVFGFACFLYCMVVLYMVGRIEPVLMKTFPHVSSRNIMTILLAGVVVITLYYGTKPSRFYEGSIVLCFIAAAVTFIMVRLWF